MNEIENLTQQILGIQAKIEAKKLSNEKLKSEVDGYKKEQDMEEKELSRLKNINVEYSNKVRNEKQIKEHEENERLKEEGINFLLNNIL